MDNKESKSQTIVYRLEVIPDFLEDHTMLDDNYQARLMLHCQRWTTFVASLWTPPSYMVTYWLRYVYNPTDGRVDAFFVVNFGEGSEADPSLANNFCQALRAFGIELKELNAREVQRLARSDFQYAYIIHQREEQISTFQPIYYRSAISQAVRPDSRDYLYVEKKTQLPKDKARRQYLVCPWIGPGGTFTQPFSALASFNKPVEIAICLKPVYLLPVERQYLELYSAGVSAPAREDASKTMGEFDEVQFDDPNAQWIERVTSFNLRRLGKSFLSAVYVLSTDSVCARGVAQTINAFIEGEKAFNAENEGFTSRASMRKIVNDKKYDDYSFDQFKERYRNFQFFSLYSEFPEEIDLALKVFRNIGNFLDDKLRYMVDAQGAATVFRLPVSVKSGVLGLDVRQKAPDFIPADHSLVDPTRVSLEKFPQDRILLGSFESGSYSVLSIHDFRRHCLITGFTGSGKTQTVLSLIHQLWNFCDVPFLIIESAKQEYRGLLGVKNWREKEKLQIYTLGNSTLSPFHLNLFEIQEGVRVETHLSKLIVCFEAALPPLPFMPSILTEAMERVYEKFGWKLTTVCDFSLPDVIFPTLSDFIEMTEVVIQERGYAGENASNIRASVLGRLKALNFGSCGKTLNCRRSTPFDKLFTRPTILELNDLNEEEKSLMTMFLLVFLREYREKHPDVKNLGHVTVVEEAHNVLAEAPSRGASENGSDAKAKAVGAFCNMLAELRALGEGLIIADQSPQKLARDALRNTNIQIAHQLRDSYDRETVASAMIMSSEQQDFIGKLTPGRAAVFYTGLERATFIQVPRYDSEDGLGAGFIPYLPEKEFAKLIRKQMKLEDSENSQETVNYWPLCEKCPDKGVKCARRFKVCKRVVEAPVDPAEKALVEDRLQLLSKRNVTLEDFARVKIELEKENETQTLQSSIVKLNKELNIQLCDFFERVAREIMGENDSLYCVNAQLLNNYSKEKRGSIKIDLGLWVSGQKLKGAKVAEEINSKNGSPCQ